MSKATETLNSLSTHLESSPASIFELGLEMLGEAYNGEYDVVDITQPSIALLATTATINAGAIMRAESLSRREFVKLAQTWEDLFPHMSSADHLDRFAKPSEDVSLTLAFSAEEIRSVAIEDSASGMKKIVIPGDSYFEVSNTAFYLGYPIEIFVMDDGQFRARWDDSVASPLRELVTNHVPSKLAILGDQEVLILQPTAIQLRPSTSTQAISDVSGYTSEIGFQDNFYAARIYTKQGEVWSEIQTTFDEQVFDAAEATARLQVTGNKLRIKMPEIYFTNSNIGNTIRVDVFTTKGKIDLGLADFDASVWSGELQSLSSETTEFEDAVLGLTVRTVMSRDRTIGGTDGITFEQMKSNLINGDSSKDKSRSFDELKVALNKEGMGVERQKDVITNRTFVATKKLEVPETIGVTAGTGTAAARVEINLDRDDLNAHIVRTGTLATIKPNALYTKEDGVVRIMSDQETISFNNLSIYEKADYLNENSYFYTPFHYVIDETFTTNNLRGYYIAEPVVDTVNNLNQNPNVGFTVNTSETSLTYNEETQVYVISIVAETPNFGERTIAVLNYTDPVSGSQWDIVGERTIIDSAQTRFDFEFTNELDIDSKHFFSSMGWSGNGAPRISLEESSFDLVYLNTTAAGTSAFDYVLAKNALGGTYTAINHEKLDIVLGNHLESLYTPMRVVLTDPTYATWPYDVPDLYEETKYEEGITGKILQENEDGTFDFKKEYEQGEQVVIDGELQWLHRKGDLMVDEITGLAIEEVPGGLAFECRLALIDAAFRFGSTLELTSYSKSIPQTLVSTLKGPVARVKQSLLEETELFFEPVSDKVDALATLEAGRQALINTALSFKVRIRLTDSAYQNSSIRDRIRTSLISILNTELTNRDFYVSRLYANLRNLSPENIKSIEIDSPIPDAQMAQLQEENASFTLASKVLVLANGEMDIVDDVDIEWST
ncbi:hypothetical protein SM033_00238 [Vibrio phage vB_VpaM_sm033]|nr:hypothetical protein SM033_00238 [Vibrio phage vB_VpaM_sm033]